MAQPGSLEAFLNEIELRVRLLERRKPMVGGGSTSVAWADITGKPTTFPPDSHSHTWSSVTDKPSTFAPSSHNHDQSDITGLGSVSLSAMSDGALNSSVWGRELTGNRRAVWMTDANAFPVELGHTASSERFKQDIEPFDITDEQVLALQPVLYRYIEQVDLHGDNAPIDFGLIAERLEDAGLHFLVFYDPDPEGGDPIPAGIHYERAFVALVPAIQRLLTRTAAVEARLDALESR